MSPLQDLVSTNAAATAAGVAPGTIRSWASRGLLVAAVRRGGKPLYRVLDVLDAERDARGRDQSGRAAVRVLDTAC